MSRQHSISSPRGTGPTFLCRAASGAVEMNGGDPLPLGVIHGEVFGHTSRLTLDRGDVLVMLTDGFME